MIDQSEILEVANETGLNPHVIEKDYVIGWVLAGIYNHPEIRDVWVFKGGTCLKKCFFETYRFSEDLDFTLRDATHLDEAFLSRVLADVADWVYQNAGINVPADELKVEVYANKAGITGGQARVYFRNPLQHTRNSPGRIKVDLTAHEVLVREPVHRDVQHLYSDRPADGIRALTYDFPEVFAEKTRALAERTRPRDLYDVINLYRRPEAQAARNDIRAVLTEKCAFKKINVPKLADLMPFREDVAATWAQMLDHQLPQLLPFETFWDALPDFFSWLEVKFEIQATAPVRVRAGEVPIYASQPLPRAPMVPSGIMGPIRFAAANRLLVDLDYETLDGRRSNRIIEPYSLRQSADGNILLYATRDDSGQPRAYRVDHIHGATITNRTFVPRFTIELTMAGPQVVQPVSEGSGIFGRSHSISRNSPATRRFAGRRRKTSTRQTGPTYVYECPVCHKKFRRKKQNSKLNKHKNESGWDCPGRTGWLANTIW
jgi:predicted nucleotidyltransferase component of viral defense system